VLGIELAALIYACESVSKSGCFGRRSGLSLRASCCP